MSADLIYRQTHTERPLEDAQAEDRNNAEWWAWFRRAFAHELTEGPGGETIIELVLDTADKLRREFRSELAALHEQAAEVRGALNVLRTNRVLTVKGTYDEAIEYRAFDVAILGGSSFVALRDAPGPCPGDGWQLLCGRGSRGERGLPGPAGERGERGLQGERGPAPPVFHAWHIDRARYIATPIMSDGSKGPELHLRDLFQQFVADLQGR